MLWGYYLLKHVFCGLNISGDLCLSNSFAIYILTYVKVIWMAHCSCSHAYLHRCVYYFSGQILTQLRRFIVPRGYRTSSYAGMPRGSYLLPNPVHYHVGRYSYKEMTSRPLFINFVPRFKLPNPKHTMGFNNSLSNATITIKVPNVPTVEIPFHVIKQFFEPFAKILNYSYNYGQDQGCSSTGNLLSDNGQESCKNAQKSDETEHHYEYDFASEEEETSILARQHQRILEDMDNNCKIINLDDSFSDIEVADLPCDMAEPFEAETADRIAQFAKRMTKYQFCNELSSTREGSSIDTVMIWEDEPKIDKGIQVTPETCSDLEINNNKFTETKMPNENIAVEEKVDNVDKSDNTEGSEFKTAECSLSVTNGCGDVAISSTGFPLDGIVDEARGQDENDSVLISILDISKGYEQSTRLNTLENYAWPFEECVLAVKKIARKIYNYIMRTCVETLEALEFPDIGCVHDAEELFDDLISIFDKYMDYFKTDQDILQLKKCVFFSVSKNLEKFFLIIPLKKGNKIDKLIEKRKFDTLKKFIIRLIFLLFDKINNPEYQCTHYDLISSKSLEFLNINENLHSTPEKHLFYSLSGSSIDKDSDNEMEPIFSKVVSQVINNPVQENTEPVTTFLAQKSDKTGSVKYWYMINDKVTSPTRRASAILPKYKPEIVEKQRRSSAPPTLSSPLSPIAEEPRRNLSMEFMQIDLDDTVQLMNVSDEQDTETQKEMAFKTDHVINFCQSSDDAFCKTSKKNSVKRKILFKNEVTFIPKQNVVTDYNDAKTVSQITLFPDVKSIEDFTSSSYVSGDDIMSGQDFELERKYEDWLGYEDAKF